MHSVGAVMVLFRPDEPLLRKALTALLPQVERLVVADNTPGADHSALLPASDKITYLPLNENLGIAAAQNRGVEVLRSLDHPPRYVMFSDQDSVASAGLVEALADGYERLAAEKPVMAVGPMPVNRKTGRPYEACASSQEGLLSSPVAHYELEQIMSSFSLMPLSRFAAVGEFNEHLFIDGVESEWFWRGRARFGPVAILAYLTVEHEFGTYRRVMGRDASISSPFRLYFQLRNYLWLRRLPYVPAAWRRRNLVGTITKSAYYPVFLAPRLKYLRSVWRGLRDGLTQRL